MEEEKKKENSLYRKWWFWLILLAIICVTSFTMVMLKAFNTIKGEIGDLALEIQGIYEDATVYSSAGSNTLFIELRNWDNEYSDRLAKIIDTVKTKVNNNKLSGYNKFVTLAYIQSNEKKEALIIRTSYSLPDFVKNEEDSKSYILFDEYQKLFNTLDKTMDSYTGLFNSIY